MPENRPDIPAELRRAVLVEAGHRCAIPTCQHPTTELAHVEPWAKVKEHTFDNLIALCPTCHTRYDRGEIDRQSMLLYKRNLPIVSGRYNQIETRLLAELGSRTPTRQFEAIPGGSRILFMGLIQDNLVRIVPSTGEFTTFDTLKDDDGKPLVIYALELLFLTPSGREFADRWLKGKAL